MIRRPPRSTLDRSSAASGEGCSGKAYAGIMRSHLKGNNWRNKKRRRRSIVAFELVRLIRKSAEPLHQQLYRQIRDELVAGNFSNNSSRLPSTRALAANLGVSRLTVN